MALNGDLRFDGREKKSGIFPSPLSWHIHPCFFFFFFSDLALPYSVHLSQSPTYQVSEGINSLKTLPSMPSEGPNLFIECPVEAEFSSSDGFQIEGLSPNKMAKVHLVLSSMDIRVYSRRKNKPSTSL